MPSISFKGTFGNFRSFDRATDDAEQETYNVALDIHERIIQSIYDIPRSEHPMAKGTLNQFLVGLVDVQIRPNEDVWAVGIFTDNREELGIALIHEFGGQIKVTESMRKKFFAEADRGQAVPIAKDTTHFNIEPKRYITRVFAEESNAKQLMNRLRFALRK